MLSLGQEWAAEYFCGICMLAMGIIREYKQTRNVLLIQFCQPLVIILPVLIPEYTPPDEVRGGAVDKNRTFVCTGSEFTIRYEIGNPGKYSDWVKSGLQGERKEE